MLDNSKFFAMLAAAILVIVPAFSMAEEIRGELTNVELSEADLTHFQTYRLNPDRPAESVVQVSTTFVVELDGNSMRRVTSIALDGEEVVLTGRAENPDDWIWMNEIVSRGPALMVLNRLLADRAELGMNRKDVIASTDLIGDTDEVLWTNLGSKWVADAKLSDASRLLTVFDEGMPVQFALLTADDVSPVLDYRLTGDFARCGQQALLDAGFDPNGVDGEPGGGARRALEAWGEAKGVVVPKFSKSNAAQVCYLVTTPTNRYGGEPLGLDLVVWPLWSGFVFYNENTANVRFDHKGVQDGVLQIWQAPVVDFFDGLRFGDQQNRDMQLPWSPQAAVRLHGKDEVDGLEDADGEASKFADDLLRLIEAQTGDTGRRSMDQMMQVNGLWYDGVRRALGAKDGVGDLPADPEWQVLWSVVDQVGDNQIVAGDILIHTSQRNARLILFMQFDPDGSDDQLLYGIAANLKVN